MLVQLPQFFENSDEGFVTLDMSFLHRAGRANLVVGAPATLEFEIESGKAGYIVERGNNLSFRWGPGRSSLKLARERQLIVELAAQILRGSPILKLYVIQYDAQGQHLRQSTLRHVRDRFHGSLTLARDVASYMLAIRLAGRGVIRFGEFHSARDATDRMSEGAASLAIVASTPAGSLARMHAFARLAGVIGRLDRGHLAKGVNLARRSANRLSSKAAVLARRARSGVYVAEGTDGTGEASVTANDRSQMKLRKLNDDLALSGKSDAGAWLTKALAFAVETRCFETAENLARYALATWPQIGEPQKKAMLVPLVETYAAVGDTGAARALLDANAASVLRNDKLAAFARMLDSPHAQYLGAFLLPSGKLDAHALSHTGADAAGAIDALYKAKRRLFVLEPQNFLLLCNGEVGRSEALYCKYLNSFLSTFNVEPAIAVAFGENVLCNIRFQNNPTIPRGPLVSVIMAVSNAAGTVGYSLRSILQQQYSNIELLICDDASTDATMAAIEEETRDDTRVRIFRSDRSQGVFNIRNSLLKSAQGEYATFHDAADFAVPSRIGLQIETLLARKTSAVLARSIAVRPSGAFVFFENQSALRTVPRSVMATKKALESYGPFRSLRFGGGAEFLERLSDAEGDGAIHRMKHPLLLDLWAGDARRERSSMEGLGDAQGIPALRRFAELAARQRLLGARTVPETEIIAALEEAGNILDPCPVVPVKRS